MSRGHVEDTVCRVCDAALTEAAQQGSAYCSDACERADSEPSCARCGDTGVLERLRGDHEWAEPCGCTQGQEIQRHRQECGIPHRRWAI